MTRAALVLAAALVPLTAHAAGNPAPAEIFALVVTNNRSTSLERPDLQYADDDGARYYQVFSSVASAQHVHLLTRFDRATAAVYPVLARDVEPPRLAAVRLALAAIQAGVAEARRGGRRTEFYFVYAGHGDMEGGSGFLDLEDGRIDASFLEDEVVKRVAADVQHIVLDSCNSFFVVNPRKPGGRRWATPKDMALGFAQRHPEVGLLLSTNSEGEVYEWSELESGIFSHEVRSGLSGAADANGDGKVSYTELAGFIERANAGLPRAGLRPHIFFRGPGGDGAAALFDVSSAHGRRVALGEGERRLWIRGSSGERLIDLHKERGPMTVVVPGSVTQELSVVEWRAGEGASGRPTLREFVPAAGGTVSLGELPAGPLASASRGTPAMFGRLFSVAYGPHAFAAFVREQAHAEEPVYGISSADEARMRHYLTYIAASDRDVARMLAVGCGGLGLIFTTTALIAALSQPRWDGSKAGTLVEGALGLTLLGVSVHLAVGRPLGQRALDAFEEETRRSSGDHARAVARTESYLDGLARQEARTRWWSAGAAFLASALIAAGTTAEVTSSDPHRPVAIAAGYVTAAWMAVIATTTLQNELPTQRLLRLYRTDPDLGPRVGLTLFSRGAGLALAERF